MAVPASRADAVYGWKRAPDGGAAMASGPIFRAAWQIPVDFTVRKGIPGLTRGDFTVSDAYGNLMFRVSTRCFSSSPWRAKTLLDALGNPLITCVRHQLESFSSWRAWIGIVAYRICYCR